MRSRPPRGYLGRVPSGPNSGMSSDATQQVRFLRSPPKAADVVTYTTMSAIWNLIEQALDEAVDPAEKLVAYIGKRFGSHQADELAMWLHSNPNSDVPAYVRRTFVDDGADRLAAKVHAARNPTDPQAAKAKASKKAEPDREPLQLDPDQVKAQRQQTAATAASRPDRAGVKPNVDRPTGAGGSHDTKAKDFQAVGTAGQNPAQPQPSLDGGKRLTVRQRLAQLQALIDDDPKHPQKDKILRAIDKLSTRADDEELPSSPTVPKTKDTEELERLHALMRDEDALTQRAMKFVKKNPGVKFADAKAELVRKIKAKMGELGKHGDSTIKKSQGMEPTKFFKQGGSTVDPDAPVTTGEPAGEPEKKQAATVGKTVKPNFPGTFPAQTWSPNAYTKDFEPDQPGVQVPGGGLQKKRVQYGDAATGQMGKGAVAANPAKPGAKWQDEHALLWAGDAGKVANPDEKMPQAGWVTKSQFMALVGQGLIRRKAPPGPSKPDLSKGRVVSPVNPPSSRANLDNTTGKPTK
jgi:hypothetical protein